MLGGYHKKARRLEWFWGNQVQAYRIPKWANFIYIYSQAAGGGGSGCPGQGSSNAQLGTSGGAPGSTVIALIPATLLPETIFCQASIGGAGGSGASNGASSSGGNNSIFFRHGLSASVDIIQNNGGPGSSSYINTPSAPTTPTINKIIASMSLAIIPTTVGGTAASSSATPGTNVSPNATNHICISAGAGGGGLGAGGVNYDGGSILISSAEYVASQNISGGVSTSIHGQHGLWIPELLFSTGGGGGRSGSGNGGNGGPGSGGGGAGSSSHPTDATFGGKGGDGFIIVGVL